MVIKEEILKLGFLKYYNSLLWYNSFTFVDIYYYFDVCQTSEGFFFYFRFILTKKNIKNMSLSNAAKRNIRANSTIVNLLSQGSSFHSQLSNNINPPQAHDPNVYIPVFFSEISDIMRGFGDSSKPNRDAVILVEKILLQQLRGILQEATDCAVERSGQMAPSQIDFEFLMRTHPVKISRLKKHLRDVHMQKKLDDNLKGTSFIGGGANEVFKSNEMISDDDTCTEDQNLYDEERTRRIFRADRISQTLNGEDYLEFNIARTVSFNCRNSNNMRVKLRSWLNVPPEIILSPKTLIILAYLAHETIATIVDYCILTRLNSNNRQTEPYARIATPGTYYDMLHLCPEVTQGRGADGAKSITVQEINEAMRRFHQISSQSGGMHRTSVMKKKFLAI